MQTTKILILLFLGMIVVPSVFADYDTVQIPTNVVTAPRSTEESTIEVHQGTPNNPEIIYWGETVDLTLVEGWYGIVERYPGGDLVDVSSFSHRIYVDPDTFPVGTWYQWSPEGIWGHGNNIAFQVSSGSRPSSDSYVLNVTGESIEIIEHPPIENLPLYQLRSNDYLVAHGDPLSIPINKSIEEPSLAMVWLFQIDNDGLSWAHPKFGNITTEYSREEIENLRAGQYTILVQYMGKNNVADITYSNFSRVRVGEGYDDVIYSPLGGENTTVSGWNPAMILKEIRARLDEGMWINQAGTSYNLFDDTYNLYGLTISEPFSDIRMIDEYIRSEDPDGASTVRVAGYTNLAKGTILEIVLDDEQETTSFTHQITEVVGNDPGSWRQFVVLYPVYYRDLSGGGKEHSFTVINPDGSKNSASYHVYDVPAGQVVPLQTIRYIGGDEFKPTPTPLPAEIVTVTVTVPVPVITIRETIRTIEVIPWYLDFPWILVWISLIGGFVYYLYWRFKT